MKQFFSANGRMNSSEFMKAAIILLIINFVLWMAWKLGLGLGFIAGLISLVTIFCWTCVFSKRFHDSGKSGFLFIPALIAFIVIAQIIGAVMGVGNSIAGEMETIQNFDPASDDPSAMLALYSGMMGKMALPSAITYTVTGAIIAFAVNALIKTEPNDNQYGAYRG